MSLPDQDPMGLIGMCTTCQAAYPGSSVRLLNQTSRQTLFHLTCEQCKQTMLFSVLHRKDGVLCSGMMTDCSFEDAQRFHTQEGISLKDVMEVHEALEGDWGGMMTSS